jgi:predicted ATPase
VWKFEAEHIGRVSRAEITMAPLVLLLGRNNTGKSYIAMLVWALSNAQTLLRLDEARQRRPEWFKAFVSRLEHKDTVQLDLTEEMAEELIKYFNRELATNGRDLQENGALKMALDRRSRTSLSDNDAGILRHPEII